MKSESPEHTIGVCHYCNAPLTKAYENDHFPIPARHGGIDLVKACIPCHDLKDRLNFEKWPPELIKNLAREFETISGYFGFHLGLIIDLANGGRAGVLLLQEFGDVWAEFEQARIARWPDLGREARILTAKLSFLLQDIEKGMVK